MIAQAAPGFWNNLYLGHKISKIVKQPTGQMFLRLGSHFVRIICWFVLDQTKKYKEVARDLVE
jgi:hypothetical protein